MQTAVRQHQVFVMWPQPAPTTPWSRTMVRYGTGKVLNTIENVKQETELTLIVMISNTGDGYPSLTLSSPCSASSCSGADRSHASDNRYPLRRADTSATEKDPFVSSSTTPKSHCRGRVGGAQASAGGENRPNNISLFRDCVKRHTRNVATYVREFLQYLSSMELVMRLQPSRDLKKKFDQSASQSTTQNLRKTPRTSRDAVMQLGSTYTALLG